MGIFSCVLCIIENHLRKFQLYRKKTLTNYPIRLDKGVNGQGRVWTAKDGYRGPEMGVKSLHNPYRSSSPIPALQIHLRPSTSIRGHPHPSKVICLSPRPSIPTKAFNTHLRPSTPTQSPSNKSQALHNHPKLFTLISGPLYPSLAIYTIPWPLTSTLGPPHQSQTLLTYPIASIPMPDVPYPP